MLTLMGLCFYCITTAWGTSDKALIFSGGKVDLPFANSEISFSGFLVIGPILILTTFVYLHIFNWRRLWREKEFALAMPDTLFTLTQRIPIILYRVIFFWMVPLTLLSMYLKASARLAWSIPLGFIMVTVLGVVLARLVLSLRKAKKFQSLRWLGAIVLSGALPISIYAVVKFERPVYIYRADLSEEIFRFGELRNAIVFHSNMSDIDLYGSDLTGARLYGSDLTGAIAIHTDLACTDLRFTKLRGANFRFADLRYVDFPETDFSGVSFENADLRHAIFANVDLRDVDFSGADIRGASFFRTQLNCENFTKAENWTSAQSSELDGDAGLCGAPRVSHVSFDIPLCDEITDRW